MVMHNILTTISRGGILSVKCIGINNDYTMSISLLVLPALAADFDGDKIIMSLYYSNIVEVSLRIAGKC